MMLRQKGFIRTEHHPFKTCGNFNCPVCVKSMAKFKIKPKLNREEFFGNSPAPFVGRFGYPYVNVGVLSPPEITEDAWLYDAPAFWSARQFQIPQIVEYRSSLINSHAKSHIKSSNKLQEISQEVGMAAVPVELEMFLKRKPILRMSVDSGAAPTGPSAEVKSARITSNPKIPQKVEKVYSDTDLKAADALQYLYKSGYDENYLTRILSVGTVGLKTNRKLVPTRWSITASDDILGKQLITTIKDYNSVNNYALYFGGYLGNYFAVMLFPDVWGYELFETLAGYSNYTTDHEFYRGRKSYVEQTAGGYYASRLPVLEKLKQLRRQASVLVIRVITDEYTVPLGVWVVRQAIRKALQSKPMHFASRTLMLDYTAHFIKNKFNHNIANPINNSKLLKNIKTQKKLTAF
jgi:DNA repair protein NreA